MTDLFARLLRTPQGAAGTVILLLIAAACLLGPAVAPFDPEHIDFLGRFRPPSWPHLFGGDQLGRDVLSRLLVGARGTVPLALAATLIGTSAGAVIGTPSAYLGGRWDEAIMRTVDAVMAIPGLLLALLLVSTLGKGSLNAMLAIGIAFAPGMARVTRSVALAARRQDYVAAAIARGEGGAWIVLREMLPNVVAPDRHRSHHPRRLRRHAVRHALLPRPRRPAARLRLGPDGRRRPPASCTRRPGCICRAGLAIAPDRDRLQPPRRRPARRAQSAGRAMTSPAILASRETTRSTTARAPARCACSTDLLAIAPGEVLGLVGESGSGKTSLAWAIMRAPAGQRARGRRHAAPARRRSPGHEPGAARDDARRRIGMVFQDPATALNPTLTIGRQLTEVLVQHQRPRPRKPLGRPRPRRCAMSSCATRPP